MSPPARNALNIYVAAFLLFGCQTPDPLLNSERIRQQFGSYGVQILAADTVHRTSCLYSLSGTEKTCRTIAIVEFTPDIPAMLDDAHAAIIAGASIGEVIRNAGWTIEKRTINIESVQTQNYALDFAALMNISVPDTLAAHRYRFDVRNSSLQLTYALITEIHHPDYLTRDDLLRIETSNR